VSATFGQKFGRSRIWEKWPILDLPQPKPKFGSTLVKEWELCQRRWKRPLAKDLFNINDTNGEINGHISFTSQLGIFLHRVLPINLSMSSTVSGVKCSSVGIIQNGTSFIGVE